MIERETDRRVVSYASRTLSEAEKRYSQIEKEALSLVYAADKFTNFITEIDIKMETDHKPLLEILQTKPIDDLTPRLQRMRIRLMRFNYTIVYVPGKSLILVDALSRNPLSRKESSTDEFERETYKYVRLVFQAIPASPTMLHRIKTAQKSDLICQKLKEFSMNE